ncbi:YD repeat-containing protein [Parabacteroides sp. PFB2-12]|uniref:RHS repeat protein n=1 Tax=unclassified Parabacteroides TaxID=2649774 RepID=UPI002476A7C8|nr:MULTISPECIES: RHS repeat domain-containing protein [unclassified Parabacteroides]MDH6343986.1 YD repeat-containing protein [Parabacteroides sp. PM6-13]MDH6391653.1 YD repeat-containing protein [Parabacteroides sp. PFB2-12]
MKRMIMQTSFVCCLVAMFSIAAYGQERNSTSSSDTETSGKEDTTFVQPIQTATSTHSLFPVIPTSPQAEAIGRYGEYGVNYSTGTPDISIPLHEINHYGYKIPVSLRYYPHVLKPGYNYDVFGLGWGLSVNSCISRTIEFVPDEKNGFQLQTNKLNDYLTASMTIDGYQKYDYNYDKFTATLPDGSSFDFVIQKEGSGLTYMVSDDRQVKISCSYNTSNIQSFTVIDESGITYTFAGGDAPYWMGFLYNDSYVSWRLTQIDLPHSTEPIVFNYAYTIQSVAHGTFYENALLFQSGYNFSPPPYETASTVQVRNVAETPLTAYKMKLLSSISYGRSQLLLTYSNTNATSSHNYVTRIEVKDNSQLVRRIDLGMTTMPFYIPGAPTEGYSLAKLTSLTIKGSNETTPSLVYGFSYQSNASVFNSLDHWGYLKTGSTSNGVANLNMFVEFDCNDATSQLMSSVAQKITKLSTDLTPFDKVKLSRTTANIREPATPQQHGVLSRITYPTGGYTLFEFENHRFLSSTDANGNYIHDSYKKVVATAAGFRIRKITNYSAAGEMAGLKLFRYGKPYSQAANDNIHFTTPYITNANFHTGVGEAVVDPNILTYCKSAGVYCYDIPDFFPLRNMILGLNANGVSASFSNPFRLLPYTNVSWIWETVFSASNFRRLVDGRNPVLYPYVTVYYGEVEDNLSYVPGNTTGKTSYEYDVYEDSPYGYSFFERLYQSSDGHYMYYEPKKYHYGRLKTKSDYIVNENRFYMLQSETYSWNYSFSYLFDYFFYNPYVDNLYPGQSIWVGTYFKTKRYYLGRARLASKRQDTYQIGASPVTIQESYGYNNRNQLSNKYVTNSKGTTYVTSYEYPQSNSANSVFQEMATANIISPVVAETVSLSSTTGTKVSGHKIDYGTFPPNGIYMPSQLHELRTATSSYMPKEQVLSYTKYGKPEEVLGVDGVYTTYLWSYNQRYLVAEIKNARYSQVSNLSGVSSVLASSGPTDASIVSMGNTLRNNLKNAMVTIFTHKPLVGVTSMTDPKGLTIYYEYDPLGRLIRTYEAAGTIQSFQYNYKQ